MKFSREKLLKGCLYAFEVEKLLVQAERVIKTWEPIWTSFLSAPVREEAIKMLNEISDINFLSTGGFTTAERQRILIHHNQQDISSEPNSIPIRAIKIEGNFLFDKTEANDFLRALVRDGIDIDEIGDIWINGDRGAQAICTPKAARSLENYKSLIRNVEIEYKSIELNDLKLPLQRIPKKLTTIEASKRLDAIASAGFGLSRAKVGLKIKEGKLRLNWCSANNASRSLNVGDQIQLEGRGNLEIISIEETKRSRWKVELLKK